MLRSEFSFSEDDGMLRSECFSWDNPMLEEASVAEVVADITSLARGPVLLDPKFLVKCDGRRRQGW